jgi:hypothetical protein
METNNNLITSKVNYLVVENGGNFFMFDHKSNTVNPIKPKDDFEEDLLYVRYKDLAHRQLLVVENDLIDQPCLFFGTTVWYSSPSLQDVLEKKLEYDNNHIYTSLYCPSIQNYTDILSNQNLSNQN